MTCYLMVKSDTTLVNKKEFENWYANEHLSEAKKALMAKNAKRGWINNTNFHAAPIPLHIAHDGFVSIIDHLLKPHALQKDYTKSNVACEPVRRTL